MDTQIYVDGQFVSQRISQVIQAIHDRFNGEVVVKWLPPGARTDGAAAFQIWHEPRDGAPYIIFHVQNDEDFDARVLKRLIHGDQRSKQVSYSELEAAEEAAKLVAQQRFRDELEEANEIAASVFRSSKSTYKISKDLVVKDYLHGNHASKPKVL